MVEIPFYRPPKNLAIDELLTDWAKVYDNGMLSNSENCRALEEKVKLIHHCDHVISCSSATIAMWILLRALKTKSILMPSFTWQSIGTVTSHLKRSFMDINKDTWLPSPLKSVAISSFDTILFQHTFGSIINVSSDVEEKVIHDAAYSLGLSFPVNDGAIISLSPTKTITSCEGGLILLNDDKVAEEATELSSDCSRLSELNAVMGLHYLEKLEEILAKKREISAYYKQKLPFPTQKIPIGTTYGFHGIIMPVSNERFRQEGRIYSINGVECRVRYVPITGNERSFPNTHYVANHILCIPCYVGVNKEEVAERILMTGWQHK